MSLSKKILLIFCGFFAISFWLLYVFLGKVNDDKPETVTYPQSTLTVDLFDSQNTAYIPQEALPIIYEFANSPYVIDLSDGRSADINFGHFVYATDDTTFYISEYPKTEDPHEYILSEYANVIYLNYSRDASYIQTALSETGYFNGYLANYFIDRLLISTGMNVSSKPAYVLGYIINLGDEYDYNLIVSIATTEESTANLEACKSLVDMEVCTLRYSEELQARREREEEAQKRAASYDNEYSEYTEDNTLSSEISLNGKVAVDVNRDFENMSILVTWTEPNEEANVSFVDSNGNALGEIVSSSSTQAIIDVGACAKGKYYIEHSDMYDVGQVNFKITGN